MGKEAFRIRNTVLRAAVKAVGQNHYGKRARALLRQKQLTIQAAAISQKTDILSYHFQFSPSTHRLKAGSYPINFSVSFMTLQRVSRSRNRSPLSRE